MKKVFLYFLAIAFFQHSLAQKTHYATIQPVSTEKEIIIKAANIIPTERQFRWQQLELTAFIHFGMNTFTEREWGDGKEDEKLFNPTQLNAEQWVQTLKDAGFKQVIITAKHHDGFCLWPTKTTEHSVKNSAWKNGKGDVVKEVAEACKKLNVGFGVYLSPWDRNSTLYGTEAYNDFFVKQLTELLTAYGKVDEVWFDGANGEGPNGKKQVYDFNRWYTLIRQLQPHAVIAVMGPDVRWVGTESGRGREMEWSVVPANNLEQSAVAADSQKDLVVKPQGDMQGNDLGSREKIKKAGGLVWYPAETDVSIRPGWFYHADQDMKVKSAKQLNDIYFTSVGMNSVLLLNVPPDKRGLINEHDVAALHEWAALRKTIFSNNFLKGALIQCNNAVNLPALNDGKYNTCFTTKDDDTTSSIIMQLKQKSTFNTLLLQENILAGQRIEKFSAYYNDNHQWIRFAEGSTVGYKRLLRFDTITTQKIKIEIESSRLNPTIAEMGLYYDISAGKK